MSYSYIAEVAKGSPAVHKPGVIYGNPVSNHARIAQVVAQVAGLLDNKSVTVVPVDFSTGQHKKPEFLKINPLGRVPVYVEGDFVLHESRAIGLYLANTQARWLYPSSNRARAKVDQALYFEATTLGPAAGGFFWNVWLAPAVGAPYSHEAAKSKFHDLHQALNYLDHAFFQESDSHVVGNRLTLADLFIWVQVDTVVKTVSNFDLAKYKKVSSWYKSVSSAEGVKVVGKQFSDVVGQISAPKKFDADAVDAKADEPAEAEAEAEAEGGEAEAEAEPAVEAEAEEAADDDMGDLSFEDLAGGDEDDDEATKEMFAAKKDLVSKIQERQAANAGNAKSNLTLDVKPFDTETDMGALEQKIRGIEMEGLKWLGASLVDVAYGIKKLRIMCQLVDVLVNPDSVREEVEKFDDEVQSTDVFAFQMA